MTDIQIQTQYSTGASRQAIEQALAAAGKDLDHLRPEDLALLEDFHTMGRIATTQLADLAEITPDDEVLDAGSGIGGTARYVAGRSRCHVAAVDLTEEYCQTARWLNRLAGLRRPDLRTPSRRHGPAVRGCDLHPGVQPARADERGRQGSPLPGGTPGPGRRRQAGCVGHRRRRGPRTRLSGALGRPARIQPPDHTRSIARGHRNLRVRDRAVERPHRPRGRDDAGTAHVASQPDRTAGLRPQLPGESPKPHRPRWPMAGCAPSRASHERYETCRHPPGRDANHEIAWQGRPVLLDMRCGREEDVQHVV